MDGYSESKDCSLLGIHEVNQSHESCNFSFFDVYSSEEDDVFGYQKDKLRSWFHQIIPIYLKEVCGGKCFRPLPAMVGDGRPVDLFELFWVVKNIGGFSAVSVNCLWGVVAKECGFCAELTASVKLVYIKYLKDLDGWLRRVFKNTRSENGEIENFKKLDLLIEESEQLRGLVWSKERKKRCVGKLEVNFDASGSSVDIDSGMSKSHLSDGEVFNMVHNDTEAMLYVDFRNWKNEVMSSMGSECCSLAGENVQENVANTYDNGEKCTDESAKRIADEVAICQNKVMNLWTREDTSKVHENVSSSISTGNNLPGSRKRKWKATSLSGMLNWVTEVATCPDDPAVGGIPGPSDWKDNGTEAYCKQALLARDALLARKPICGNGEESYSQKKPKMHDSISKDKSALHQSTERVRCSKTLPLTESQHRVCCNTSPANPNKRTRPCKAQKGNERKVHSSPSTDEVLSTPVFNALHMENTLLNVRHVSVGLHFQAEVPEWTGVTSESDSKWLGKRMWHPEDGSNKAPLDEHSIGKGRQTSCDCSFPGSTVCVRLHIAEERMRLKLDLGPLFYHWKFNKMGEEVSLSWTTEEEERFKNMVIHNYIGENKFWKNAFKLFPNRTREQLVSYYFNVLVLRRRIYQNRVTPKDIDSDDDQTDFGSIGDSAYFEGNHATDYDLPICSLNTHLTDVE